MINLPLPCRALGQTEIQAEIHDDDDDDDDDDDNDEDDDNDNDDDDDGRPLKSWNYMHKMVEYPMYPAVLGLRLGGLGLGLGLD